MNEPSSRALELRGRSAIHPDRVHMTRWDTTDDTLFTTGVHTCIALAAINKQAGKGLLGHFTTISIPLGTGIYTDRKKFNNALKFIPKLGPPEATRIRLAGGYHAEDPEVIEDMEYAQKKVHKMAKKLHIPQSLVVIDWLTDNDEATVEIDCRTGEIAVEEFTI